MVSGLALNHANRPTVAASWPQPGHFDVVAVGINRHARSPEVARRLIAWLVDDAAQAAQFDAIRLLPVDAGEPTAGLPFPGPHGMRNANVFGLYEADAIKLAERARWY